MSQIGEDLHIVFLPFFTSSHLIPLVNAAKLFASRGVRSTVITTVHTAQTLQASGITIHTLNFPSSEVGLPVGIELINSAPTQEMAGSVFRGMMMLQPKFEQVIRELAPDCIFSDMFFPWTVDLADQLNIPRLLFYPSCFFYHSVLHSLRVYKPHESVTSESERFVVPNLPDNITMTRAEMSEHLKTKTEFGKILELIYESEKRSYGFVHDTFYEMEPAYVDHFKKTKGVKVWHIGPLFRFFNRVSDYKHDCLSWLDYQHPKSVIYICFGSMASFLEAQITEIALALEDSKRPFVWVVGKAGNVGLPEGFEERARRENKGLIISQWAPQVEILQHPAVGGFLTHCGWNSTLEAVVAGVPLVTWPLFAEQFYNAKLLELLGIGVGVGADVWNLGYEITSPIIMKRDIIKAIELLLGDSGIAESIRQNSKELAIKTNKAIEDGGSSINNLMALIEELKVVKLTSKP
ncbi:solanidine UDP-glucose glucosyltransferase 1-like [Bidens hawaiensis]|uniref:solanidine UDP-glucose glucosyltransferase 1-like n=1 Tax=Bidens hawaiensis TaxID=980011 RepID=UPI004049143A